MRGVSDVRWGAKLTTNLTGNDATWWNQGNYVEIQGFEITGSGALGIYNEGSFTRIIDNTVQRVGLTGIDVINTIPDIRSNVVADTDLDKGVDTSILVNSAQDQGRVDCNTLSGNPTAVSTASPCRDT